MGGLQPSMNASLSGITPVSNGSGAVPVNINYSPFISSASSYEAEQVLKPIIENIVRGMK